MNKLPNEIINKIMLFNSHPVADLLKASTIFIYCKYPIGSKYYEPFLRGRRDALSRHAMDPHYWSRLDLIHVRKDQMTEEEIEAYIIGYENPYPKRLKQMCYITKYRK